MNSTFHIAAADFARTRRAILAKGGKIVSSVFTPTGFRVRAVFPA